MLRALLPGSNVDPLIHAPLRHRLVLPARSSLFTPCANNTAVGSLAIKALSQRQLCATDSPLSRGPRLIGIGQVWEIDQQPPEPSADGRGAGRGRSDREEEHVVRCRLMSGVQARSDSETRRKRILPRSFNPRLDRLRSAERQAGETTWSPEHPNVRRQAQIDAQVDPDRPRLRPLRQADSATRLQAGL